MTSPYHTLAFLFLCVLPGTVMSIPDFPLPPDARVEIVANDMVVNGLAMNVRNFYTRKSVEKVAAFYREEWAEGDKGREQGYTETDAMEPWKLMTRIENGYLMTVQFQEADQGGSWGYMAISRLPVPDSAAPQLGKKLPFMNNSVVMREMQHSDPGKDARTVMLSNHHSVTSNVSYYRNHFRAKGWRMETDQSILPGKMHSLVFKSTRKRINIMLIGDHRETRVVINEVVHSIL